MDAAQRGVALEVSHGWRGRIAMEMATVKPGFGCSILGRGIGIGLVGCVGVMVLTAPAAMATSNCDWYATTALQQQQQNEKYRCGFSGPDWTSDRKAHLAWCASVSPDLWKKAAQKRYSDLETCASGKK